MRILVTLPQASAELKEIAAYCLRHHLDLRRECWHFNQEQYEFHIIYARELDQLWVNWLYLQWPGRFFQF